MKIKIRKGDTTSMNSPFTVISMIKRVTTFLMIFFIVTGCKEEKVFEEPYAPGKQPLGVVLDNTQIPSPASGITGTEVKIAATGLLKYKDELIFRFNGETAEIKEVTDEGITVVVPESASSGVTSISIGDVVFFGPEFTVSGLISFDPTYTVVNGTDNAVYKSLKLSDGKYIMVGNFTNYDNKATIKRINRIVRTFSNGTYDASFRSGNGANGALTSVVEIGNKFFIAGSFSGYDQRTENISNITRIANNGIIDTMGIHTFRRPDQTDTIKYFPTFNGGVNAGINSLYEHSGKLLITGGFRYYVSRQYDKPNKLETRDSVILDSIEIPQVARLNTDGTLDKTYRFDAATGRGLTGGNGPLQSFLHKDNALYNRLLVFGRFTAFDGAAKGYITRLLANGNVDPDFNRGGTGADGFIYSANYNANTGKYVITGNFRAYNGKPVAGIAMLNSDGTLDESFTPKLIEGGTVDFAKQLNDGLIVVSGYFSTYGGVIRNGFMILDPSGNLANGYNATGMFSGFLSDVFETTSEDGKRALLLMGNFSMFNNEEVRNITRIVLN